MNESEKVFKNYQEYYDDLYKRALERFPKPGNKLRYRGTNPFWFTDIIANAERELRIGEIYTLKNLELARSYCIVTLEETGETRYSLSFFDIFSESEQRFKHPAED